MTDLTLDEKLNFARSHAGEIEAEKHFFDAAQPYFPLGFSVIHRTLGHWDIIARETPGKISAWLAGAPRQPDQRAGRRPRARIPYPRRAGQRHHVR